jgi:hypothetical protein
MVSGASGAARSQKAQQWKRPNTIGTRERAWQKRQKTRRDIQRRTRRSASTIGGAAPDTIIGRATADRAGARPYRATRCENASKMCHAGSRRRAHFERIDAEAIFDATAMAKSFASEETSTQSRSRRLFVSVSEQILDSILSP